MTIKLYDLVGADSDRPFSPHCWKTAMSLAHKGLDFERVPTRFPDVAVIEGGVSRTVPVINDKGKIVQDSFAIAEYLEDTYPDRPSLFGGQGGRATARFIESWTQSILHAQLIRFAILDIHNCLGDEDQIWFRKDREAKFGKTLEEIHSVTEQGIKAFGQSLLPLRLMLRKQAFIGGEGPLFPDYIVFGALQWVRAVGTQSLLPEDDPVRDWFERCLDLHDGLGRSVSA